MIVGVADHSTEETRGPVVADVFAPVDVLGIPARLELSALVAVPGRVPAVLPEELARSPLPADPAMRAAVGAAIEAGLAPAALATLRELRLDAVVPALRGCDGDVLARFLPDRMLRRVARHLETTDVAALTVGAIAACPGIGGRAGRVAGRGGGRSWARRHVHVARPTSTVDDVATVLAYDASDGGALRAGLEALAESGPPEVRAAVERMLTASPVEADWRLTCLERVLAAAGDGRDRAVFEHLVLGPGPWVEPGVVAAAIGVGQERLRQLRLRAGERVDAAARDCPPEVRELATALAG